MIRLLGILSVILFWILVITLSPIVFAIGTIVFAIFVGGAISSLVYQYVTNYLRRKQL